MASAAEFRSLIQRLEQESLQAPGRYKAKLLLLSILGYGFLIMALLVALLLSLGLVLLLLSTKAWLLLKFAWIPLAIAWTIVRSLWVRFEEPEGYRLRPGEAPELEAVVERLRAGAGAPRLSGIVVTPELNAAAASVPRLLGLAGNRCVLVLGLPLLQALSPKELSAVLAHEFGHFGGGHTRFAGWIYRIRNTWYRLLHAIESRRTAGTRVFQRFFGWYAPYFNAYSFVLARQNEFEADRMSARLVGAREAGDALIRVQLSGYRLHREFWPAIDRLAGESPEPPGDLYRSMGRLLAGESTSDADYLREALAVQSDIDDTHPVLAQRLNALGVDPGLPPRAQTPAAQSWLGTRAQVIESHFSREWLEEIRSRWAARHEELGQQQARLHDLGDEAVPAKEGASPEELVEMAMLLEDSHDQRDPEPLYRAALAAMPESGAANFRLGRLLLHRGRSEGVAIMESLIDREAGYALPGLECIASYHQGRGDTAALDSVRDRIAEVRASQASSEEQRRSIGKGDQYSKHGLDAEQASAAVSVLAGIRGIGRAWLVRKHVPGDQDWPHFVLMVRWRGLISNERGKLHQIVHALQLPGSLLVFVESSNRRIARRIRKTAEKPMLKRGWF
jgi:Zn-dependent protease with chaperone function